MKPFVATLLLAGTAMLSVPIILYFRRRIAEGMRAVADELGFTYQGAEVRLPRDPEEAGQQRTPRPLRAWGLTGTRDGVAVTIYPESRGSGSSPTTYSIVEASFPRPLPFTLRISRETSLTRFGKAVFHIQDIKVGSDRLDAGVRIQTSDPERARRLLADVRVQDRILTAIQAFPATIVTEKAVIWERRGTVRAAETLRTAVDAVVPVVVALRGANAFEQP